ncbi:hypothetical protein K6119_12515 [Paracrocinitomix mangrovi]|uniref:LBF_2804 family protein n=1 Tax=Paracrocinitomix mangrovi TaxID=2862509 RepID=UPI001C8D510A|nr:hypothetical protein [Paracrocinitomix mangrovi]UKN00554.1 hypothetical protein K6119_12515 [Paracrocinitomix mangrovi]
MADKKNDKKSFWTRIAEKELKKINQFQDGDDLFILNEEEQAQLKSIKVNTLIKAAIAGTLGVLLLYLPYHYFGESLFPVRTFTIPDNPIYSGEVPIEVEFMIYSIVLVMIEIWYLTYINIKAVGAISNVCGHPNPADENYQHNLNALIAVGLEKKQKQLEEIGINPYEGLSKTGVVIFQFLLRLKATASNILFRIFVKKILGRYALRFVLDMAGIPVYAFWNMWGSSKVIKESKIRVMAPPLIKRVVDILYEENKDNQEFRKHIYDSLQLISESKRSFHYNHFLLSLTLLNKFEIEIQEEPEYNEDFLEEIPQLSAHTRDAIEKLYIFGIMIDGKISFREMRAIRFLIEKGALAYTEDEIMAWSKDYDEGRGIEGFFKTL